MNKPHLSFLAAAVAVGLALTACGGESQAEAPSSGGASLDTVTVQLDYTVRGNHAMFFVADELGFFEEEGIDVKSISKGTGSPDAMRIVGNGQADFGFGDLPTLVTARSQGVGVTALAAVNQETPLSVCSLSENLEFDGMDSLAGRNIGVHPAGSTYLFWKALLAANGMTQEDVNELTVTPPYESFLLTGKVDAVICYVDAEVPELEAKAGGEGSLSILLGSEYGYDVYGSGMFTSDKLVEENPELVQRFTNAYIRAFDYVLENPKEAADILAASSSELKDKAPVFLEQIEADIKYTFESEATKADGLGAMTEQMWQATIDVLVEQGVIADAPETSKVYSNTFVKGANG